MSPGEALARQLEAEQYNLRELERERVIPGPLPQGPRPTVAPNLSVKEMAEIIRRLGCKVEAKNGGSMLVIRRGVDVFDFWPTNGKWAERDRALDTHRKAYHRAARKKGVGFTGLLGELRPPDPQIHENGDGV